MPGQPITEKDVELMDRAAKKLRFAAERLDLGEMTPSEFEIECNRYQAWARDFERGAREGRL